MTVNNKDNHPPLCVDLDGTLIHLDSSLMGCILLCKKNILFLFALPFWLLKSRAYAKYKIYQKINPVPKSFSYNQELLTYLKSEKNDNNRFLVLVTGANTKLAKQIADDLNLFDSVMGSDSKINLTANNKAEALNKAFGKKQYDYIGNSTADFIVWENARYSLIVNPSQAVTKKKADIKNILHEFPDNKPSLFSLIKTAWVENTNRSA